MSESPEAPETLMEKLQAVQFEWVEDSNQWIIPNNKLERLINFQNVSAELVRISSSSPIPRDDLKHYAREICQTRKKLFAILICGWGERNKCCKTILGLVDEGIKDSDLPFDRVHLADSSPRNRHSRRPYKLCIRGHTNCTGSRHRCIIKALQDWPQKEIDDFSRDQWMVLSPVFRRDGDQIPHYDFDDRTLMPFKKDYERTDLLTGGYSEVWPVRICSGHQSLYKSLDNKEKEPKLAIKRLFSTHPNDFKNETDMLKAMSKTPHKYLVELLATYKYKGKYHLLFPYAKANLRTLWAQLPEPGRSPETQRWALDQMTGLASGLAAIHTYQSNIAFNEEKGNPGLTRFRDSVGRNLVVELGEAKFGRHGDLKAENILWFNDVGSGPSGLLQITDFGLGHFHRLESRSVQDPRKITGSETYIPPEIPLNQLVSRKYDLWSLGCVFLEFVTWLLEGSAGLEEFGKRRMERAPDGVKDDTFYSLVPAGMLTAVIRPGVQDWIEHLERSPYCFDMIYELLDLVKTDLLVVQPESRSTAENLYMKLKRMLQKSNDSSEYLTGRR